MRLKLDKEGQLSAARRMIKSRASRGRFCAAELPAYNLFLNHVVGCALVCCWSSILNKFVNIA